MAIMLFIYLALHLNSAESGQVTADADWSLFSLHPVTPYLSSIMLYSLFISCMYEGSKMLSGSFCSAIAVEFNLLTNEVTVSKNAK